MPLYSILYVIYIILCHGELCHDINYNTGLTKLLILLFTFYNYYIIINKSVDQQKV